MSVHEEEEIRLGGAGASQPEQQQVIDLAEVTVGQIGGLLEACRAAAAQRIDQAGNK